MNLRAQQAGAGTDVKAVQRLVVRRHLQTIGARFIGIAHHVTHQPAVHVVGHVDLRILAVIPEQVGVHHQPVAQRVDAGEELVVPHRFRVELVERAVGRSQPRTTRVVATAHQRSHRPVR